MKFYRYETVQYAEHDFDGDYMRPSFPNPTLECREYVLIKETPKGYWIGFYSYKPSYDNWKYIWKKWVSKTSKKRFAYPSREEALNNYIKRTERRIKILEWDLEICKRGLEKAKIKEIQIQNEYKLKSQNEI